MSLAEQIVAACPSCNGSGLFHPHCVFCADSTHDHECPPPRACQHEMHALSKRVETIENAAGEILNGYRELASTRARLEEDRDEALRRASACEEAMIRAKEGYETERMEHARTMVERDAARAECIRLAAHIAHVEKLLHAIKSEAEDLKAEKLSLYARLGAMG